MDYRSKRWEAKRDVILRRDGYECQYFKRFGKHVEADTVHHIYPADEFPEFAFENWNLISLSREAHNMMHDRQTGALTNEGLRLQERTKRPIEKIIVCGLPGTGKTTYVRDHLGNGLAFDLDYLVGAFRLAGPKEDPTEPARRLANDLLRGFADKSIEYASKIFIIRTAPRTDELEAIKPNKVILLTKVYEARTEIPLGDKQQRLDELREYCERFAIPLLVR